MTKALSIRQPWATLLMLGAKTFETRHWSTPYRGKLIIHAAKYRDDSWFYQPLFHEALVKAGFDRPDRLPYGCAIGKVDFLKIWRTEDVRDRISATERAFGNYENKRFAWYMVNPQFFAEPVPWKGMQSLFDIRVL